MHKPSETKPRIKQLNLTALCTVCHAFITLVRSRVQMSTTSTPKPTTLKFTWKYRVSFETIRTVINDQAIQQRRFNYMLHGRRRWKMNTEVFWDVSLCGLVNCYRRFDRTMLHGVLLLYCTNGAFTLTGSVSILILSHDSQWHFRNAKRTDSNTNPDRAPHAKLLDYDDDTALVHK